MNDVATEDGKKTRGDGLVKVVFANDKGADHKRVPEGVQSVILNGKAYSIASIPQQVKDQLVAFAFGARAKTYVNNHADEAKGGTDVPELIAKVYQDMLDGKLYAASAEGGAKKTKEYDPSDLIEAFRLGMQKVAESNPAKKPATPEQLEALRNKIIGLSGKDRTAYVLKCQHDPIVGPIYSMIRAKKKMQNNKDKVSIMEDLF